MLGLRRLDKKKKTFLIIIQINVFFSVSTDTQIILLFEFQVIFLFSCVCAVRKISHQKMMRSAFVKSTWIGPFGRAEDLVRQIQQRWIMEGTVRKITIKTRQWRGKTIIQGFQVCVRDGGARAFGMNYNDLYSTVTFTIPDGRQISKVCIESDAYIHSLGFILDNGDVLGPVGTTNQTNEKTIPEHCDDLKSVALCGISGITLSAMDLQRGNR
ncbi:hypothetical protein E2C01_003839 [Portunus trituberculatus]|uniref:Uncharacterized protein n=1 Tax=Portunus trituberculatus TaxID=210409 RepID=A0A5B7CNX5_PORTR|nr:hypothetical protein [Portunus trituberculatus]